MTLPNAGIRTSVGVSDESLPAGSAPLTFGQLAAWREAGRLPRARWHEANVFNTFTLPRPVSLPALNRALSQLEAKHPSLRTIYDLTDPRHPRQRLLPPRPASEVELVELVHAGLQSVEAAVQAVIGQPFELSVDRPFRALAIADQPSTGLASRIVLCLHHIACDGWSIGLLWTDLLALLGIEGEPLPPAPGTLFELAHEQRNSTFWQQKLKASQRHFRSVYQAEVADFRHRESAAEVLQVALESAELAEAAQLLSERHQVSIPTVFTTVFLAAVAGYCSPGPIRIGLMTSNRFLQRWEHQVTSMNQLVPVVVPVDPLTSFEQRLAATQLASMRAFRIGMFDVDAVSPAALGLAADPALLRPLCVLNIVNGAATQYPLPAPGHAPALHWEQAFNQIAAGCNLRVLRTQRDTVLLRLRTGGLAADTAAGILTGTLGQVIEAASHLPAGQPG